MARSNGKKMTIKKIALSLLIFINAAKAEQFDLSLVGLNSAPFAQLTQLLGLSYDGSLKDLVAQTQSSWLRPAGTERWNIEEKLQEGKKELYGTFTELGLVHEWQPKKKHYKYAVLFGAALFRVQARLSYLAQLWDAGVRFDTLILLAGQRDLADFEKQALAQEYNRSDITLEPAMMQLVYDTLNHAGLKSVPLLVVDGPRAIVNGKPWRATTATTVAAWMEQNPEAGDCLLISSQPFCNYQEVVAKTLLPATFNVETVGSACSESTPVELYLDTLARTLYQYSSVQPKV